MEDSKTRRACAQSIECWILPINILVELECERKTKCCASCGHTAKKVSE